MIIWWLASAADMRIDDCSDSGIMGVEGRMAYIRWPMAYHKQPYSPTALKSWVALGPMGVIGA